MCCRTEDRAKADRVPKPFLFSLHISRLLPSQKIFTSEKSSVWRLSHDDHQQAWHRGHQELRSWEGTGRLSTSAAAAAPPRALCRKRIECVCSAARVARVSDDHTPFAPFALRERLISYMRADLNVLPQTITFTPPLTLILGANGSGKTTVIEVRFPMISCARHSANLLVRIVQGRTSGVPSLCSCHGSRLLLPYRHCAWLRAVPFLPIQVSSAKFMLLACFL